MKAIQKIGVALLLLFMIAIYLWSEGAAEEKPSVSLGGRTVVDCFDREVMIPEKLERVACLYAFSVHVTTMLGEGDKITAVVNGSKRDMLLNEINPHIEAAATPSDDGIINIEELLASKPDLVFLKGETARLEEETAKLELFSIPYVVIDFVTIEEQMRAIEVIGAVFDKLEQAQAYNAYYREVIAESRKRSADIPREERVRLYHSVNEAARTDAAGTLMAEWTEIAGAVNVSVGSNLRIYENKYFASIEQILNWDPEVIICNQFGVDQYILSNEKWATIEAVEQGRVYKIPTGISRWGHPGGMETPLAILWTMTKLYPERSRDIDLYAETRRFYAEFFDYEISDELLERILSGGQMRLKKG